MAWYSDEAASPEAALEAAAAAAVRQARYVMHFIATAVGGGEAGAITADVLLELNRLALEGVDAQAGSFRSEEVMIAGSRHEPPAHIHVVRMVDECCRYMNDLGNGTALHRSAYALWRINWIHPFGEGNGRVARAAAYMVFSVGERTVLPGDVALPERIAREKIKYYRLLGEADRAWKRSKKVALTNLEQFLGRLIQAQLREGEED